MRIEIWSDVLCPFCYIGKRHLELALADSTHAADAQIAWKSFQLNPAAPRFPQMTNAERLAKKYGRDLAWANEMHRDVTARAARVGIHFDLARAVPTNSFDAHRLIHLAAASGLQDNAEERLFAAHFTEGRNIGDHVELQAIGDALGLERLAVSELLAGDRFAEDVRQEAAEARAFGVRGVPFFLFDRHHAISGAQPIDVFLEALRQPPAFIQSGDK